MRKNRTLLQRTSSLLLFAVAFLVCMEVLLRIVSYEEDGRIYLFSNFPLGTPPTEYQWRNRYQKVAEAEKNKSHFSKYDSILGWSYRPNSYSNDSLFAFDENGMRKISDQPHRCSNDSCFHVLLTGNSYVMSYETPTEKSLGYFLDSALTARGISCQIKIAATANYSIDQSYLEWKHRSHAFKPDLVLLGYNPKHSLGNATLFHYLSFPETKIYFTKPCATLDQTGNLNWVNLPTLRPEKIIDSLILNFEKSPLYEVEHARTAPRTKPFKHEFSYLYSCYRRAFNYRPVSLSQSESNRIRALTKKIMSEFQREVKVTGAEFMLLEIPIFEDLLEQSIGIERTDSIWEFQNTETLSIRHALLNNLGLQGTFVPSLTHYNGKGNRVIAIELADQIQKRKLR